MNLIEMHKYNSRRFVQDYTYWKTTAFGQSGCEASYRKEQAMQQLSHSCLSLRDLYVALQIETGGIRVQYTCKNNPPNAS